MLPCHARTGHGVLVACAFVEIILSEMLLVRLRNLEEVRNDLRQGSLLHLLTEAGTLGGRELIWSCVLNSILGHLFESPDPEAPPLDLVNDAMQKHEIYR